MWQIPVFYQRIQGVSADRAGCSAPQPSAQRTELSHGGRYSAYGQRPPSCFHGVLRTTAPVLIASGSKVVAEFQRWGIPGWRGGLMINARAETVCEKPMFRRSMAAQRCVVPATGYYEWDAGKHKYFFQIPGKPLYLAGIYDNVEGINCFVVLTTKPNTTVQDIHDRMPLILTHEQVRPWLTSDQDALQLLTIVPAPLIKTRKDGQLRFEDYINS